MKTAKLQPKNFAYEPMSRIQTFWVDAGARGVMLDRWWAKGPKTIQTFAGHATLAITMDRYGHLFKSDDHAAAMDQIAKEFSATAPHRPEERENP